MATFLLLLGGWLHHQGGVVLLLDCEVVLGLHLLLLLYFGFFLRSSTGASFFKELLTSTISRPGVLSSSYAGGGDSVGEESVTIKEER